ncbi:hypothetical protein WICPIJ_004227 [Wickerhamomyces pijperi]|uniref:Uncharacterized protein n=1 Tax=Wickerhamomyces pijperi TaxID=599730 RepID=A0A9P8TM88_WICPI|nr:hypothetical protein WICPIJ_004227 [Wickerhamomyces pijperi]
MNTFQDHPVGVIFRIHFRFILAAWRTTRTSGLLFSVLEVLDPLLEEEEEEEEEEEAQAQTKAVAVDQVEMAVVVVVAADGGAHLENHERPTVALKPHMEDIAVVAVEAQEVDVAAIDCKDMVVNEVTADKAGVAHVDIDVPNQLAMPAC